ncbi:hypothetical protein [Altererythrobacter sp. MTPC7]|uniref:hypothetical protein n=1 Tax=Altererythrobacter sp. MTPC7 TaxID=3056567 RepID=UPI0036F20898
MKLGKLTLAAAAGALAVAPIAAQASVADRSAPLSGESEVGGSAGAIVGLFGLLALAIAIGATGGDDDDFDPISA